jgi:hypothetical protein
MERVMAQQHDHWHSTTLQDLDSILMIIKILWGLGERECTKGAEGMAIARLDMMVQIMLIARIVKLDMVVKLCWLLPPSCVSSLTLLKQLPTASPSVFGFSQAWIWKWSLDSASRNSSIKDCYTDEYGLFWCKVTK